MAYKVSCSNCGKYLFTYEGYEKKYKSPLSKCKKCGSEYIDPRCKEMAVEGFPEDEFKLPKVFVLLVIGGLIAWRGLYLFGLRTIGVPNSMQWLMPGVITLLGAAFIIGAIVEFIGIVSGIKRKKYEKKLEESKARMSDATYVEKLKKLGYIKQ